MPPTDQPRPVRTPRAPLPAGHYSQAIVHGGVVYVSGQLPIDPARGPIGPGEALPPIEEQTRRALDNLHEVLLAAGSGSAHVLRCTVYISDVALWPAVNRVYAEHFTKHTSVPPARTVVPTGPLHYGYQVEVDAVAVVAPPAGPEAV